MPVESFIDPRITMHYGKSLGTEIECGVAVSSQTVRSISQRPCSVISVFQTVQGLKLL